MIPNIDPKQLKNMMAKMGIKSSEVPARRVVIEGDDKEIVIENPQILAIEAQGTVSFQISGNIIEKEKKTVVEITEDDIKTVMEQAGVSDRQSALNALQETNGDIAEAIMKLKGGRS